MQPQNKKKRIFIVVAIALFLVLLVSVVSSLTGNRSSQEGVISDDYELYSNSWYSINYPKNFEVEDAGPNVDFRSEDNSDSVTIERYGEVAKLPKINDFSSNFLKSDSSPERVSINGDPSLKVTDGDQTIFYIFSDFFVWKISFTNVNDQDKILETFKPDNQAVEDLISIDLERLLV